MSTLLAHQGDTPRSTLPVARAPGTRPLPRLSRVLLGALGVVLVFPLVALFGAAALPRLQGGASFVVRSGSMAGSYPVGSIALTKPIDRDAVRPGFVVLVPRRHVLVLHRVVALRTIRGERYAQTKGDANPAPDPDLVKLPDPVLVAYRDVPVAGYLLGVVSTPIGWALLMVLPAALVTTSLLVDIWFPPPRQKRGPGRIAWKAPATLVLVGAAFGAFTLGAPALAVIDHLAPVGANTFSTAPTFP